MQVWALKSYTKSAPLYVQCLRASSLHLIKPFLDPARDVIVSVEQTRHRLLALSCLCPGASTLLGEEGWHSCSHACQSAQCTCIRTALPADQACMWLSLPGHCHRVIWVMRAHEHGRPWRAVCIMPS